MFGAKSGPTTKKTSKQPGPLPRATSLKSKDTKTKENPAPAPSIPESSAVSKSKDSNSKSVLTPSPSLPESTTAPKSNVSNPKGILGPGPSVSDDQMSFSFNVSESEKSLQSKLDAQKKTVNKLKLEAQALKDENSKLKLELEKKEALLKSEGFMAKRNYLLKAKVLQQEKHIIILESQIRGIKNLETEIYSQLENTIRVLEKFNGNQAGGIAALRESGKIEDTVEFLKMCQVRLSDCGSKGRYEYGLKAHKDGISTLEKEEREEEGDKIVEKSGIRSRLEFEDSLVGILDMLETVKEQLSGEKHSNLLVNLCHLTRKVTEFMISEGFDVRKVKKVFGKRDQNGFIQKNIAYFEHLSKHLRENADIIAKFNQATESMAQETVSKRGIKTVSGYVEEYMRALSEDKREKLMKNKDVATLVESLREISKVEKYMHESQRAILSLFSAKAFVEIESLRDFVEERVKQVLAVVESDLYGPFKAMYTIYKNYENMGNEFSVGVNILSVFGMAGEGIMQALEKLLGLGREFKKGNEAGDISLRMVVSVFEKRVMTSLQELGS